MVISYHVMRTINEQIRIDQHLIK